MAESCWFVESVTCGKFEGWWAGPPRGEGGWLTTDPLKAQQYTQAEAVAVAEALSYFPSPFRWSAWVATEHIFTAEAKPEAPAELPLLTEVIHADE